MTPAARSSAASPLDDLLDDLAGRLQSGELVDLEAIVRDHPEYASQLRRVLPAVQVLAGLPASGGATAADGPAGQLGDYRLVREVGRGGMGVVYEAEQRSLRRRVALKVLPLAAALDPKQLQRFKNEALAAASLKHDHIVSVYAVGCERGVHYYAMEFVDGQSLAESIDRRAGLRCGGLNGSVTVDYPRGDQATPPAGATTPAAPATAPVAATLTERVGPTGQAFFRTAAGLIADAADALEHAHALGIIHRDVKPGNLLLDTAGKVYVSDFGLARFGPDAGLTVSGDLLGTLRYMAPEQALAQHGLADHRVDVYGLGCTLYELLTGRPAVNGDDKAAILHNITAEDPVAPRRLDKAISAELETITLKCLAKSAAERYATAGELADDLRRWLADQPIRARRASLGQRFRRWRLRHRLLVRSVSAALLAAVVVLAGSIGWVERDRAARRATAGLTTEAALAEADRWEQARNWPAALAAMNRAVDAFGGDGGAGEAAEQARHRRDVLALVIRLEEIRLDIATYRPVDGETILAHRDRLLGAAFRAFGLDAEALEPDEIARRMPTGPVRDELVAGLDEWARARRIPQEPPFSKDKESWRCILAAARAADTDPVRSRFRDLWERGGDQAKAEAQALVIPDTLHPGAMSFVLQLLPDKAQRIQFLRGLQRRYPGDYSVNVTLASNLTSPGTLRGERPPQPADINEAIGFLRAAVALRPSVPSVRGSLASALGKGSRPEQVEEGIAIARALAGDESTADVGLGSLSALLRQTGRPDDAVAVYREAIRRWPAKAQYHYALGQLLSKNQSWGEAAEAYREAIRLSPQEAHYHASLGETLRKKNALGEATAAYAEAARLNPKAPSYQFALGETLEAIHDPIAAAAAFATAARLQPNEPANHFRRALVLMQVEQWAESAAALVEAIRRRPDAKAYYCYLAKALSEQGQLWEADATFEVADLVRDPREDKNVRAFIDALFADDRLRLSTRLTGAGILSLFGTMRPRLDESRPGVERRLLVGHKRASLTPDDTAALNDLAWLLATGPFPDLRDPAEAVRLATRATELIPNDGDLWNTLGAARYRAGDWAASATALEKSMQLRRGGDAFDWFFLAMCRRQLGDHDQARKWYDRAANSMTKKDAQDDELRRFRAEAAELLGIPADPKPEPPAKAGETPKAPGG